jgi:hypothetical protein
VVGDLAPEATADVDLGPRDRVAGRRAFAERLSGRGSSDSVTAWTLMTRFAVTRSLLRWSDWDEGMPAFDRPDHPVVVLAWRSAGPLEVDVEAEAKRIGETVYVLPARVTPDGMAP